MTDNWSQHLPRDLKVVVLTFLDAASTVVMMNLNKNWQNLTRDEHACRLAHDKCFGVCTSRDMDIFQFDSKTSWTTKFNVRAATARNWLAFAPTGNTTFQIQEWISGKWCMCQLDGSRLNIRHQLHEVDRQIDMHTGTSSRNQRYYRTNRLCFSNPDYRFEDEYNPGRKRRDMVITNKMTNQVVSSITIPDGYTADQTDCDPMSDLVLMRKQPGGTWISFRASTGQQIAYGYLSHFGYPYYDSDNATSMVFDGLIYDLVMSESDVTTLTVINAWTGQHITRKEFDIKIPLHRVILPRSIVFFDESEIQIWDRQQLVLVKRISTNRERLTNNVLTEISSRECLLTMDDNKDQRFMHIDMHGNIRMLARPPFRGQELEAFNSRWLVVRENHILKCYDMMPRVRVAAVVHCQHNKRFKSS